MVTWLCHLVMETGRAWAPFLRALVPFMTAQRTGPNHFAEALPSNTIALKVRIRKQEFMGGDTNIQIAAGLR